MDARPDASLLASGGKVPSSSQGLWGSQVVTPVYRQVESDKQRALGLRLEPRQAALGTLASHRAQHDPMQPRRGGTQDRLWPPCPRPSPPPSAESPGAPPCAS